MRNKYIAAGLILTLMSTNIAHATEIIKLSFVNEHNIEIHDKKNVVIRAGEYPGKAGKRTKPSNDIISRLDPVKYPLNDDGTLSEYYINKQIALAIQRHLNDESINVILQDTEDSNEDLNNAGEIALQNEVDLYFSVHTNASPNKDVKGFYMLTSSDKYKHNKVVEDISNYIGDRNSISQRKNAYETTYIGELNKVTNDDILAMICEYGFYTNEEDLLLLTDKGYVDEIGKITAQAIIKNLKGE